MDICVMEIHLELLLGKVRAWWKNQGKGKGREERRKKEEGRKKEGKNEEEKGKRKRKRKRKRKGENLYRWEFEDKQHKMNVDKEGHDHLQSLSDIFHIYQLSMIPFFIKLDRRKAQSGKWKMKMKKEKEKWKEKQRIEGKKVLPKVASLLPFEFLC